MNMRKINALLLALMAFVGLTWTSCTDTVDYTPAGGVEGAGVYFPTSVRTSYELEGEEGETALSGSITLAVMRTDSVGALDAALTATFSEGGESVFSVPATVSFADGKNTSSLTIDYANLTQGPSYNITLTFAEGTPYSNSTLTLTVSWPEEIVYTWEVVSENAIYKDNLFSMYGASAYEITGITVEKAEGYELYRFKSPYNNEYMDLMWGEPNLFPGDFEYPYIIVDGETYEGKYYIAPTALGFKMTDGEGVSFDTSWNTFGSIAGNLSTSSGPIGPDDTTYPLGSYDSKKKLFDLGAVYHNLGGYGFFILEAGNFTLALDPALLSPDYDRDYTWKAVPEATGFFTSELMGESWMQAVEQSEEDETFYRMPNLYSNVEKAHFYFHVDMETGEVTIPRGQDTGLTTFGNKVYLEGTPNRSSYDSKTGTLTLGLTFYLADEDGKNIADLQEVTETFLWGQSEFDQLQKGTDIADYVGNWVVSLTDGSAGGQIPVSITQIAANTLAVQGLTAGMMGDYDDTMLLSYDKETGWVRFDYQQVAGFAGYSVFVVAYNSETGEFSDEGLIGGLDKAGNLKFLNDESNEGKYDAMVYMATDGQQPLYLTGYWNNLVWAPYSTSAQQASFNRTSALSFQKVEQGFVPRRTYKTELNIQPKPRTNKSNGTNRVSFDSSLMGGANTTFSMTR